MGLASKVKSSGFGVYRIQSLGFRVRDLGLRVQGQWYTVTGFSVGIQRCGFEGRVLGFKV